jgi:cystinosin
MVVAQIYGYNLSVRRRKLASVSGIIEILKSYGGPLGLLVILVLGVVLGIGKKDQYAVQSLSNNISSFLCWTSVVAGVLSFWPQIFLNWYRQSIIGLSIDGQVYNLLSLIASLLFHCTLYFNPQIRFSYGETNDGLKKEILLAMIAITAMLVVLCQCYVYPRGSQKMSRSCLWVIWVLTVLSFVVGLISSSYLLLLSFITPWIYYLHVVLSILKYAPQLHLNYCRKSASGFAIWGVLFDLLRLEMDVFQMCFQRDIVVKRPFELVLSLLMASMDILLLLQYNHYVWSQKPKISSDERLVLIELRCQDKLPYNFKRKDFS